MAEKNTKTKATNKNFMAHEFIENAKKTGKIGIKDINTVIDDLNLDGDQQDALFDNIEKLGIEIIMDSEEFFDDITTLDDEDVEAEELSKIEEEGEDEVILDTDILIDGLPLDDPVRMYLKEIGKVDLLSMDEEKSWPREYFRATKKPRRDFPRQTSVSS